MKSIIIGVIIFVVHNCFYELLGSFRGYSYSYNDFWGSLIYGLVLICWLYCLLAYLYTLCTKNDSERKVRYLKALMISLVGFMLSRVSDIINGQFFDKFMWSGFLIFFLFVPLLVELEILLSKWQSKK